MSKQTTQDASTGDLTDKVKALGLDFGFQQIGITDTDLGEHVDRYQNWLKANYHGDLDYMERHGEKRWQPDQLVAGTLRVITVRMDYLPENQSPESILEKPEKAYISRYTLGRDYHKLIRKRLKHYIKAIQNLAQDHGYRAFVDSAPVLERALAQRSGQGWFGKNTMILNRDAGSWFFLGEIYTSLPLQTDSPFDQEHCGRCTSCLDICPTGAFVEPYVLDGRKCISYLTIEYKGSIPEDLRAKMGNRIFGCDDCQIVCPWNRFASESKEPDFQPRHELDNIDLADLFLWDETTFLDKTEGSAIRRAGYECWLRNIAVALGNAPSTIPVIEALKSRQEHPSPLVREHVQWALAQHTN